MTGRGPVESRGPVRGPSSGPAASPSKSLEMASWTPPDEAAAALRRGGTAAFAAAALWAVRDFLPDDLAASISDEHDVRTWAGWIAAFAGAWVLGAYASLAAAVPMRSIRIFAGIGFTLGWSALAGQMVLAFGRNLMPLALFAMVIAGVQSIRWAFGFGEDASVAGRGGKKAGSGCASAFPGLVIAGIGLKVFGKGLTRAGSSAWMREAVDVATVVLVGGSILAFALLAVVKFRAADRFGGASRFSALADFAFAGASAAAVWPLVRAALPAEDIEDLVPRDPDPLLAPSRRSRCTRAAVSGCARSPRRAPRALGSPGRPRARRARAGRRPTVRG
ncbi:MAG: hypothetical protein HMLKMBBP_03641 [Planctomycetes bacterium]|nr:hypothetical protein [Planctomycetota bacterium]